MILTSRLFYFYFPFYFLISRAAAASPVAAASASAAASSSDDSKEDSSVSKKKSAASEFKVHDEREHMNVVFIGHVDAGKSTTCGNILYVSKHGRFRQSA